MTGGMDQSDLDYEPPRLSWFQRFKEWVEPFRFNSGGPTAPLPEPFDYCIHGATPLGDCCWVADDLQDLPPRSIPPVDRFERDRWFVDNGRTLERLAMWERQRQVGWLTPKGKLISLDQCTLSSEQMTAAGAQRVFVEKQP